MTNRGFFLQRREAEYPVIYKVLEALPEDQFDYRPHPASRSARELGTHMVYGDVICTGLIADGFLDYQEPDPAKDKQVLLAFARQSNENFLAQLRSVSDGDWQKKVTFKAGRKEYQVVLGEFLWFIHFGVIHHRGQLSTYIRPMGGKVPAIYGPSGDEPGL